MTTDQLHDPATVEKLQGDLSRATAREQKLLKVIERHLAQAEATKEIAKLGGEAALLLPHVMKEVRVIEDGDDFVAIVVQKDGKTRRIKDGSGNPMTIADLVGELKSLPTYAPAFEDAGGGSDSAQSASTAPHQISRADAKDYRKYVLAKAAADKAGVELDIVDSTPTGGSGKGGDAHTITITAAEARNARSYVAAKEKAEKAGATLEIVER